MRPLVITLLVFISAPIQAADGLCQLDEQVLFSCRIAKSTKQVALCATPKLDERGWLIYRFGTPGKIELEFPGQRAGSLQRFSFGHYMRYQTDYTDIAFNIGKVQYTVYDYYQGEEKSAYARGVRVTTDTGKEVDLACHGKVKSELLQLEGLLPCIDKDNCPAP